MTVAWSAAYPVPMQGSQANEAMIAEEASRPNPNHEA